MDKKVMVELPDFDRVLDWLEANRVELTCRIKIEEMSSFTTDVKDVRITVERDADAIQTVLLINFCMALRAGKV